jgi:hypothetical protein
MMLDLRQIYLPVKGKQGLCWRKTVLRSYRFGYMYKHIVITFLLLQFNVLLCTCIKLARCVLCSMHCNYWLIICRFTSRSLIWTSHNCRWRAADSMPMVGGQGFRTGWNLYRATPTVRLNLSVSDLIRSTTQFSHLLLHGSYDP